MKKFYKRILFSLSITVVVIISVVTSSIAAPSFSWFPNGLVLSNSGTVQVVRNDVVDDASRNFIVQSGDKITITGSGDVTVQFSPSTGFRLQSLDGSAELIIRQILLSPSSPGLKFINLQLVSGTLLVQTGFDNVTLSTLLNTTISTNMSDPYIIDADATGNVIYLAQGTLSFLIGRYTYMLQGGQKAECTSEFDVTISSMVDSELEYFDQFNHVYHLMLPNFDLILDRLVNRPDQ